jgi:hypothetical protein
MNKIALPLLLTGLLLSGCAGLIGTQAPPAPTPEPGFIETQIAEGVLLTSFPLTQSAAETEAADAVIADLTAAAGGTGDGETEEAPPTETLVPTNTPEPSEIPPSPTTLGATAVPTVDPENPKAALGSPALHERFDNGNNWEEFDIPQAKMDIAGGEMLFTIKSKNTATRWSVTWMQAQDYYMEVTANTPASCSGKDRYGLFFRAPDPNQGYIFMLTCDGTYTLVKWDGSNWNILINYTNNTNINQGGNATNLIAVYAKGNEFKFYANDKLLTTITDNSYLNNSRYGVVVGSTNTDNFTVRFDDLKYWTLP